MVRRETGRRDVEELEAADDEDDPRQRGGEREREEVREERGAGLRPAGGEDDVA